MAYENLQVMPELDPNKEYTIDELTNYIRNAMTGKNVREALARSMEATNEIATWARDVAQGLIDGAFDAGELATMIESKLNQLEQDYAPKLTSLENEIDDARGSESSLGIRLEDFSSRLDQTTEQTLTSKRALNYYWIPEQQPAARADREGYFIDAYRMQSEEVINDYFEPMRLANSDYIYRFNLGKDHSGQYDIWRYHFTPKNYTKTVIITTGLHGGEVTPIAAMMRFLHYLVNDWEKYPILADIRENVRIIYIPFANPWGTNQPPGQQTRYNSRGVDLNRNFEYKWQDYAGDEAFGHDFKGEAPFSEVETQYIRDTLLNYPDAIAYLDFHNTGAPIYDYYVAMPENSPHTELYDKLLSYFTRDLVDPNIRYNKGGSANPNGANYALNTLNIPASIPEWCDRSLGESTYDSTEITKSLEWFSNIIIEHAREFTNQSTIVREQYYLHGGANTIDIVNQNDLEIEAFKQNIFVPFNGIAVYEGFVTVGKNSGEGGFTLIPMLGQTGNGTGYSYNDVLSSRWSNYVTLTNNNDRISVPFTASVPIRRTDGGNVVQLGVGLVARTSGGASYRIFRYKGTVRLFPSDTLNHQVRHINL